MTTEIDVDASDFSIDILGNFVYNSFLFALLTRSLREPGGPCTKSMEVSESCMERVNSLHVL